MSITAKAVVTNRQPFGGDTDPQVVVTIGADYADEANKEWAYYTPLFNLTMNLRGDVADQFPMGKKFTVQFSPTE